MISHLRDRRLWQHTLILLALGWIIGVAVNAMRSSGAIPLLYPWSLRVESLAREQGIPMIDATAVQVALEAGTHWALDARSPAEYYAGTLPGALSLPRADADNRFPEISLFLAPEESVITFCSSADCDDALLLTQFLHEQGITNAYLFIGGIEEWVAAGFELEGGS